MAGEQKVVEESPWTKTWNSVTEFVDTSVKTVKSKLPWENDWGNRPSESSSVQRSQASLGDGIKNKQKPLQGSESGLHGGLDLETVYESLLVAESNKTHLDEKGNLVKSPKGAEGISQLLPSTAKKPGYGIEPVKDKSEKEYLRVGKEYLSALYSKFGDMEKALAAYNAGPGNVMKAEGKADRFGGDWKEYLPRQEETLPYINKILKKDTNGKEGAIQVKR